MLKKRAISFLLVFVIAIGLIAPAVTVVAYEPEIPGFEQAVPVIIPEVQIPIGHLAGVHVHYWEGWTQTTNRSNAQNEDFVITVTNAFDRVGFGKAGDVTINTDSNGTLRFTAATVVYLYTNWYTYTRATVAMGQILTLSNYYQVRVPTYEYAYNHVHEDFDVFEGEGTTSITFSVLDEPYFIYRNDFEVRFITNSMSSMLGIAEPPSSWAVEHIDAARAANIVPWSLPPQYPQPITRAEFASLAVLLYEIITGEQIVGRVTFIDTSYIHVRKAAYIGIVTGVGDNRFEPQTHITREQAAVMLARLVDVIGQPLPSAAPTFADNAQISAWAFDAVGQIQAAGIMGGVGDNVFSPQGTFTREQSIITILRLFEMLS